MSVRRIALSALLALALLGAGGSAQPLHAADSAPVASSGPAALAASKVSPPPASPSDAAQAPVAPVAQAVQQAIAPQPVAQTAPQAAASAPASAAASAPALAKAPAAPAASPGAAQSAGPASGVTATQAAPGAASTPAADSTAPAGSAPSAKPGAVATAPAAAAAAAANASAPAEESDQSPSSTFELLDEDNRLDQAHEEGNDSAPADAADGSDPGDGSDADAAAAAAALIPPGSDGAPPSGPEPTKQELFPSSPGIEKQKAFWIKIFTHYDSRQGVLHDGRIALPVYEDLQLEDMSYRAQRRHVRERKRQLAAELRNLAEAVRAGETLTPEQQALRAKLPADATDHDIREFARNVRFQRGLADRFRDGLIRSGALLEPMREILARYHVPKDLVYLPHVESSFNNDTRSKFGAMGIWQFTRGTGRIFMTVRYEVDERLDPIIASEAAAKFLRQNYERLGTWPLAITAYNHGPQSLERITHRMGTRDLGVLIQQYDGRLFKFASKNFYAEFLAAREVAQHSEQYFGPLKLEPTLQYEEVELPWHVEASAVADALGIDEDELRDLNPALRPPVWSGSKYIPPDYSLRIPPSKDASKLLAAIPESERHSSQKRSLYVRVARGDTLFSIGRRNGISWRAIALANNIGSSRRLRQGQQLILPWTGTTPPPAVAGAESDAADSKAPLAGAKIIARIPVASAPAAPPAAPPGNASGTPPGQPGAAPALAGATPAPAPGPSADRFQELRVVNFSPTRKEGEIVAAYGETVGAYAGWAGVTPAELRRLNDMSSRSVLRPGQTYLVPLDAVTPQQFEERRKAFHVEREQSFFAVYDIREKVRVEVQRGQSPWALAQDNNVPMWLFYRENPRLLTEPLRAGMEVILPVLQAGSPAGR